MANSVRQWGREAQLLVGKSGQGTQIENLRLQFEIVKTITETPNAAVIRVFNLHPDTAAKIRDEYQELFMNAGYHENVRQIFAGNITYAYNYRDGPDIITQIEAGDGDHDYRTAVVNATLAAGTGDEAIIDQVIQSMARTTKGYTSLEKKNRGRGRVISGNARDVLNDLAREHGVHWSIQDEKLVMVPVDKSIPNLQFEVNANTGMLGAPETNDKGISVKMLLNPDLRIGGTVHLDNNNIRINRQKTRTLQTKREKLETNRPLGRENEKLSRLSPDGVYKIISVTHRGDTRGNQWESEVECVSL